MKNVVIRYISCPQFVDMEDLKGDLKVGCLSEEGDVILRVLVRVFVSGK